MGIRVYPILKSGEKLVDVLVERLGIKERYEAWLKRYDAVASLYTQETEEKWYSERTKLLEDHLCDVLHCLDLFGLGKESEEDEFRSCSDVGLLMSYVNNWYFEYQAQDYEEGEAMDSIYHLLLEMYKEDLFSGFECC